MQTLKNYTQTVRLKSNMYFLETQTSDRGHNMQSSFCYGNKFFQLSRAATMFQASFWKIKALASSLGTRAMLLLGVLIWLSSISTKPRYLCPMTYVQRCCSWLPTSDISWSKQEPFVFFIALSSYHFWNNVLFSYQDCAKGWIRQKAVEDVRPVLFDSFISITSRTWSLALPMALGFSSCTSPAFPCSSRMQTTKAIIGEA